MQRSSSWIGLTAIFTFAGFSEGVYAAHVMAFLPLHLPRLGVSSADIPALTGWIVAISSLLGVPFLPFWGALADRFSRKPVIVRSFVAFLLAGVVMAQASSLASFVVGRALISLAQGNSGLMLATLSERVPCSRLGLAFGFANAAGPLGACLGPAVGGLVFDAYGMRALLGADVVLLAIVVLVLIVGYRDPFVPSRREGVLAMARESVGVVVSARVSLLLLTLAMLYSGWLGAYTYVPLIVARLPAEAPVGTVVGAVLALGGLAMIALAPLIGAMADRFGHRRVLYSAASVQCLLFVPPAVASSAVGFAAAWAALTGVAGGVFSVSLAMLAQATPTEMRGRVMVFSYLPVVLGTVVGPALAGAFAQAHVTAAFPLGALATVLALVLLRTWVRIEDEAHVPVAGAVAVGAGADSSR